MMNMSSDRPSNSVTESSIISTYITQDCLVFPVLTEMSKEMALGIQASLLGKVHSKDYLGVVIDLSRVDVIDSVLWDVLSNTSVMVNMLGFSTVLTGLSPGVVASIVDVNVDITRIKSAMTIQDALDSLKLLSDL